MKRSKIVSGFLSTGWTKRLLAAILGSAVCFSTIDAYNANASEGVRDVAKLHAMKQGILNFTQHRLDKHKEMSVEAIVDERLVLLESNRATLNDKIQNLDMETIEKLNSQLDAAAAKLQDMRSWNKAQILAYETAEQQQVMTSVNYLFSVTRSLNSLESSSRIKIIFVIIAIPIDIIFLPVELIASALTGF